LGGVGSLWGPAVGALILIPLAEFTRSYMGGTGSGLDLAVYGALIMVVSLTRPEGLLSIFDQSARRRTAS
ncbi:hypothetical protein, partial [Klebsiella pneumoniae]|uniref:hypothetical protein n=1 Tax=Klebsiella pneumoniae TaxID=573 RepID=UPI003719CF77